MCTHCVGTLATLRCHNENRVCFSGTRHRPSKASSPRHDVLLPLFERFLTDPRAPAPHRAVLASIRDKLLQAVGRRRGSCGVQYCCFLIIFRCRLSLPLVSRRPGEYGGNEAIRSQTIKKGRVVYRTRRFVFLGRLRFLRSLQNSNPLLSASNLHGIASSLHGTPRAQVTTSANAPLPDLSPPAIYSKNKLYRWHVKTIFSALGQI